MPNIQGNPNWKPKYGEPTKVVRLPQSLADSVTELLKQGSSPAEVLQQLESVSLLHKSQFPEISAIYFVYQGEKLLYIGRTKNLKQRWLQHHRHKQFAQMEGVRVAWFPYTENAPEVETTFIELLKPGLNEHDDIGGQLNIRVDDELKRAFLEKAKADGTTATDLLVGFMRQYLGLEASPNSVIDPTAIEATIRERLDTRLVDSEASIQNRIDIRLAEIEARIAGLEKQQLGELAA